MMTCRACSHPATSHYTQWTDAAGADAPDGPGRRFACQDCDDAAQVGTYAPCSPIVDAADLDDFADELADLYTAAVIRRQDRAAAVPALARGYRAGLRIRAQLAAGRGRLRPAVDPFALAMLAPYRGSGPLADRAQRHGRYMYGRIVAARRESALLWPDSIGPLHPDWNDR